MTAVFVLASIAGLVAAACWFAAICVERGSVGYIAHGHGDPPGAGTPPTPR